jgi:hypothetical protein
MNSGRTETEHLIEGLARGLGPVRRLPSPGRRAAAWSLAAVLYVAGLVAVMVWLAGSGDGWSAGLWTSQLAAATTSVLASAAAFAAVIPGSVSRWRVWTGSAALAWLATLIVTSPAPIDWAAVTTAHHEWLCIGVILLGGAPLLLVLASLLRRGAPLSPMMTTGFAALAAAAFANVAACVTLPHPNGAVTFVWHGGAVVATVLVAALCGPLLFGWTRLGARRPTARPTRG